jgi:hypothetical protein
MTWRATPVPASEQRSKRARTSFALAAGAVLVLLPTTTGILIEAIGDDSSITGREISRKPRTVSCDPSPIVHCA